MALIALVARIGQRLTGGYFTANYVTNSGRTLSGASRVPVDMNYANGAATPQTGSIIPGTVPANPDGIGVTATAGGTKAAALQLDYGVSQIAVAATAADSVQLPYAFPGAYCEIYNNGASAVQVFGAGTDTINAVATATGLSQAAGGRAIYRGITGLGTGADAGTWQRILSA